MQMMAYLSKTCKAARIGADITLAEVARRASSHESGLSRFEAGLSYPRDVGAMVDGYATAIGITPQMIWADALRAWVKDEGGLAPERIVPTQAIDTDDGLVHRISEEVRSVTSDAIRTLLQSQGGLPKEDRALLDMVFASVPVAMAFVNTDLRYVRINQNLSVINGLTPEEHYGSTVPELFPDLWPQVQPCYEDALSGTPVYDVELQGETPAVPGRKRTWLATYIPVPVGEPVVGVLLIVREVTEHRRLADLLANGLPDVPVVRAHQEG